MKRLAFVPLLVIPAMIALALMAGLASGSQHTKEYSISVAVNVEYDPSGHAEVIDMPTNIKLTVQLTTGGRLSITGSNPWVEVSQSSFTPDLGGSAVSAPGIGTVAGIENVAVGFTGTFDPEHPDGPTLTGFYAMGIPGFATLNTLPGGQAIEYRIKRKPGGSVAPTPAATATEQAPTATVPGLEPPKGTPVSFDPAIVVKVDADTNLVLKDWEMNVFQGDGCTGSPILSGPTDDLGEFGTGYAVFLPPGDYSVSETQQPGWERVDGTPSCQNFTPLDTITFANRKIRDGDVNNDGVTNSLDVLLVLQTIAGLIPDPPNYVKADVNEDGAINAIDTALMLQFDAGFLDSLPIGSGTAPPTSTPMPAPPTPTNTPAGPAPTNTPTPTTTNTPSNTGTVKVSKEIVSGETVIQENVSGWEINIYMGGGCVGSPFATATTGTSPLQFGFSPGDYSLEEKMQPGFVAVSDVCQDVDLDAGEEIHIIFQNAQTP